MTSPARNAEADRVELVYFWALQQIANQTYSEFYDLWQDVPKSNEAATAGWWLSQAIQLLILRRARMRDLAIAYYRLVRALRTGATISDPLRDEGETVSLERLRDEFEAEVDDVEATVIEFEATSEATAPNADESLPTPDLVDPGPESEYTDEMFEDDDDILVEEIADLERLAEEQDMAAEEEAAIILDQLGIENMLKKLEDIDREQSQREAEAQAQEAHEAAGRRQAAAAQRITMNAARGLTYSLAETDRRVLGWMRYSRTGTPCGWCAMLLSRQAFYKTKRSAQHQGRNQEEDKFHDNCRCVAVPIFFKEQVDSDLFALNRHYTALWNKHIKNKHGGDEALTVWRKLIRDMHKQDTATVPEAA